MSASRTRTALIASLAVAAFAVPAEAPAQHALTDRPGHTVAHPVAAMSKAHRALAIRLGHGTCPPRWVGGPAC